MRRKAIVAALFGAAALMALGVAAFAVAGEGKSNVKSDELTGYQESAPAAVSSTGTGSFRASIDDGARTITYELRYSGLESVATQSHIHFGDRHQNGGISAFLCTNLGNGPAGSVTPACPAGMTDEAVVTGTITPAQVVGPAAQGILPTQFDELVRAIRAGIAYANVHTTTFPSGEVRGQINDRNQRTP
jgi:CHRD domain-containing protein